MDIQAELQRRESIIRRFRELEAKPIYIRMLEMETANLRARAFMNQKSVFEIYAEQENAMRRIDQINRLSSARLNEAQRADQLAKTFSLQI